MQICMELSSSKLSSEYKLPVKKKSIVCGNDGLIYVNYCQFLNAKCIDSHLSNISKRLCKGIY